MFNLRKVSQVLLLTAFLAGCQADNQTETDQINEESTETVETQATEESEEIESSEASNHEETQEESLLEEEESETLAEEPASPPESMDLQALNHGDFSSIAGSWRTIEGLELVFDENGLVSDEAELSDFGFGDNGNFSAIISAGSGSNVAQMSVLFIPAGQAIAENDGSDISQDRIWIGKGIYFDVPELYYYRVQ